MTGTFCKRDALATTAVARNATTANHRTGVPPPPQTVSHRIQPHGGQWADVNHAIALAVAPGFVLATRGRVVLQCPAHRRRFVLRYQWVMVKRSEVLEYLMGTRSITYIEDSDGQRITAIYRQFDGYLEGHGAELSAILSDGIATNGISQRETRSFNGADDLAAHVITDLKRDGDDPAKNQAGNIYVMRPSARDVGEEYVYTIRFDVAGIIVKVSHVGMFMFGAGGQSENAHPDLLFNGTVAEFADHIAKLPA